MVKHSTEKSTQSAVTTQNMAVYSGFYYIVYYVYLFNYTSAFCEEKKIQYNITFIFTYTLFFYNNIEAEISLTKKYIKNVTAAQMIFRIYFYMLKISKLQSNLLAWKSKAYWSFF